jgi:hypothetical protein
LPKRWISTFSEAIVSLLLTATADEVAALFRLILTTKDKEELTAANHTLVAWQDRLDSLNVAVELATTNPEPTIVFLGSETIAHLVRTRFERIQTADLEALFTAVLTRIRSDPPLDDKCTGSMVQCLAVISCHHVACLDQFVHFEDIAIPFFVCVCECKERCGPYGFEALADRLNELPMEVFLPLLGTQPMSWDWLRLCGFVAASLETWNLLYAFEDRFAQIAGDAELFAGFFDFFKLLAGVDQSNVDEDDRNFLTGLMEIMLGIADSGLAEDDGIARAVMIYDEVLDYSTELLSAESRIDFTRRLLDRVNDALPVIANEPEELLWLVDNTLGEVYGLLLDHLSQAGRDGEIWPQIMTFIDILIDILNHPDFQDFLGPSAFAVAFRAIAVRELPDGRAVGYQHVVEHYRRLFAEPSSGLVRAIAVSGDQIRGPFMGPVLKLILDRQIEANVSLFFILKASSIFGAHMVPAVPNFQRWVDLFDRVCIFVSAVFASGEVLSDVAMAIVEIVRCCPRYCIEHFDQIIAPILEALQDPAAPAVTVVFIKALAYLAPHMDDSGPIFNAMCGAIQEVIGACREDLQMLFDFICAISSSAKMVASSPAEDAERENLIAVYSDVFDQIVIMIEPLWTMTGDAIRSNLCLFLDQAMDSIIVRDLVRVVEWITDSLIDEGLPDAMVLLKKYTPRPREAEPHRTVLSFVPVIEELTGAGNTRLIDFIPTLLQSDDSNLAIQTMGFVRELVRTESNLVRALGNEVLIGPLLSQDSRLVEMALGCLVEVAALPSVVEVIDEVVQVLVNGMFTTFDDPSIQSTINIFVMLILSGIVAPGRLLEIVAQRLVWDNPAAGAFAECCTPSFLPEPEKIMAPVMAYRAQRMVVWNKAVQEPALE